MDTNQMTDGVMPVPAPTSAELELAVRRELVLGATELVSDVIGAEVSVVGLTEIVGRDDVGHKDKLTAKRGLRFLEAVAKPGSVLVATVGEKDLYHAAEAFIVFGANEGSYCELVTHQGLSPEQATGLFSLRQSVQDMTDDRISFTVIQSALDTLRINPLAIHNDPEAVLIAFESAGFFTSRWSKKEHRELTGFRPDLAEANAVREERISLGTEKGTYSWESPEVDLGA